MSTPIHNQQDPLPFNDAAELEFVKSLNNGTILINNSGTPDLRHTPLGENTIGVTISVKITTETEAGLSIDIYPLSNTNARFNLHNLKMQLIHVRSGSVVEGAVSDDNKSINFFPLIINDLYRVVFPDTVAVRAGSSKGTSPSGPKLLKEEPLPTDTQQRPAMSTVDVFSDGLRNMLGII